MFGYVSLPHSFLVTALTVYSFGLESGMCNFFHLEYGILFNEGIRLALQHPS